MHKSSPLTMAVTALLMVAASLVLLLMMLGTVMLVKETFQMMMN